MSQLLAPAHTFQGEIPLWRRIREIMKEKGSSHSITAMAARIGISRETLRVMLNGDREIYWFELEKIAQDLKVPLKRLLMEDLQESQNREMILRYVANNQLEDAMKLAKERQAFAIGLSERAQSLSLIAYVHFWAGEYELAKSSYLQMRPIAEEVYEKYQDQELLTSCLSNLLNIHVELQQYDSVPELLETTEPLFRSAPVKMGMWYYAKGKWKSSIYDREQAKACYYQCLEQMQKTDHADAIGRARINVATAEYADRNYLQAKEILLTVTESAGSDAMKASAWKELAKTLIKLKELQAAEDLIRNVLGSEWCDHFPDVKGRLSILLSRATGNLR